MCHPHRVGGKSKDRKKKNAQSARQAAQRRAVQQRTAERRVRDLRFRLLSARDASAAAGRLMDAFADRDRVSCAYDAEAMVSAVAGRMAQAGFAGDQLRDACLDICDALAASSAPLAVGILRAFAVVGPDSAVRDHARILADAAGRTAPAWAAELGQAIPGKCWAATDPFRESTVLLCEFSYPARGNRHAVLARLDPVWHDAVSSLAALFLEEEGSLDAGSATGLARRLGADLREVPEAEAAGLLQAGLDAFAQHGPAPWAKRDSEDYRTTLGRSSLISAHGNWLPRPKAQARRMHAPGPSPADGRPGNASAWSRSSTARHRAGHSPAWSPGSCRATSSHSARTTSAGTRCGPGRSSSGGSSGTYCRCSWSCRPGSRATWHP